MDIKTPLAGKQRVTLQINAGYGPRECGWVVAQVLGKLLDEACKQGVSAKVLELSVFDKHPQGLVGREPDAYKSVRLSLTGKRANSMASEWLGTVKWEGESPYRIGHKRHSWYVAIQRIESEQTDHVTLEQLEKEVRFETTLSTGPGGQHVNKTSSAVWITHLPTNLKLKVAAERSQQKNRRTALKRLQRQLNTLAEHISQEQRAGSWMEHRQVERGRAVKTFAGKDFVEKH